MTYKIKIKETALKVLRKAEKKTSARVWTAISKLANEPRPAGSKKMVGPDDLWRIRVGDWRVIYQIRDHELIVLVARIGQRKEVYR
jgi:mRNA interferase RelE/StbE